MQPVSSPSKILALAALLHLLLPPSGLAHGEKVASAVPLYPSKAFFDTSQPKPVVLRGAVEMRQLSDMPQSNRAAQLYRQGTAAIGTQNYALAAQSFKQAGDYLDASIGESRYLAEARFAEAQMRMLLRQEPTAAQLYQLSADLFRKYDPYNPFFRAAVAHLARLNSLGFKATVTKKNVVLKPMKAPGIQSVDRNILLQGGVTHLSSSLKNQLLPAEAGVPDEYVKKVVYKAFVKMTCLETTALGSTYYSAPNNYKAVQADGKPVAISASSEFWAPVVKLRLNGKMYGVSMDLPGLSASSKNVVLVTDGRTVLAIDPSNYDSWKLCAVFKNSTAEFNWWKLTHRKDT